MHSSFTKLSSYLPVKFASLKKISLFFNAGIEIRTGDQWKLVAIEENCWGKFLLLEKTSMKMKTKYLFKKLWSRMILNRCLLLNNMANDSLEIVGKLSKLQVVNDIHPSIISMMKTGQCSLLKLKAMYCNHETYHKRYMAL